MSKEIIYSVEQLQKNKLTKVNQEYTYLKSLNYEQQIAATTLDGNILVLAGPGSGKTHTLVFRIVHMLKSGINPQDIVLITFTRKAANEIKERVHRIVGNVEIGFIGTFHAFAIHISKMYQINQGWRILDTEDDLVLLKMVIAENNIKFTNNITNKTVLKILSYSTNTRLNIHDSVIKMGREELKDEVELLEKVQKLYSTYKKKNKYLSYDDVINLIIFYLGDRKLKYQYLMIDEYQDTNQMQLEFINTLNIKNIMAIGDDFQGIYSFRGADPNIILNFYNDYSDAKLIVLKYNYRSDKSIVSLLNEVTDDAKIGFSKELISNSKKKGIVKIEKLPDDYATEIIKHHQKNLNERVAFIYRANRDKTDVEKELIKNKVDYVVYGGIRLLERRHIKDIFAFLLVNKNKNDLISYLRILLLLDGVGEKTAKSYLDQTSTRLKTRADIQNLEKLLSFEGDFKQYIDEVIRFYSSLTKPKKNCNYTDDELAYDYNLIKDLASEFDDVVNFINDIVLNQAIDMFSKNNKSSKVILTTIHSAKGLEFDTVFHLYARPMYGGYDLETLEENRRLFYVAISRAKSKLIIWNFSYLDHVALPDILNDFKNEYNNNKDQLKFHFDEFEDDKKLRKSINKDTSKVRKSESNDKKLNSFIKGIFRKR